MFISPPARFLSALPKLLTFVLLTAVGIEFFRPGSNPWFAVYWICWLLASLGLSARFIRTFVTNWHFQSRARAVLPASGADLDRLTAAAMTLRQNHEERALYILQNMTLRSTAPDVARTRAWLQALASAR